MFRPEDGTTAWDAAAVRERLMHDRVPDDVLASALGVGLRSVYYYAQKGLPYIRIGGRRYFDVNEAREWLIQRKASERSAPEPLPPPRPVGRPRKPSSK